MFDMSISLLIAACLTIMFSAAVQTAIGFGLALIAVPILLLIDPAMVPAPVVIIAFVQVSMSAWLHRADIQWSMLKMAIFGRIPGTLVAMALMLYFGQGGLKMFVAVGVLIAVVVSLFKFKVEPSKKNHLIAGFFSGITGTTSAIGGPPMALLYQHQKGDFVRANLSVFFAFGCVLSLIGMGAVGYVTVTSWLYAGLFLPSTFIGVWLGLKVKKFIKPAFMRPAILTLCSGSALAVLVNVLIN